ncbi:hypothetical protein [Phaeobacter sp. NW0010-22]|uniref:hypothetical protein n=1 Tax=Phaeobacter sp. NW0010-22 TaxID=3135907 RepID=UPI0031039760
MDEVVEAVFVMTSHKYITKHASTLNVSPPREQEHCDFARFEPYGFLRFVLKHRRPVLDLARCHNVDGFHLTEITAAKFAINRQIREGKITMVFGRILPDPVRPDMLWFQRAFPANEVTKTVDFEKP